MLIEKYPFPAKMKWILEILLTQNTRLPDLIPINKLSNVYAFIFILTIAINNYYTSS